MTFTPSVDIRTNITTKLLSTENDGSTFLIAENTWGPENQFLEYEGSSEVAKDFKSGTLVDTANAFVIGGGKDIKVYRFTPNNAVNASLDLLSGITTCISLEAKYAGTYGNSIACSVESIGSNVRVIITDSITKEVYDNDGAGLSSNSDIVTTLSSSTLVTATLVDNNTLIDTLDSTFLASGANGTSITISDVISIVNEYIDRDYKILLVPEITANSSQSLLAARMEARANDYKIFSVFVTGISASESYSTTIARTATSNEGRLIIVVPGSFELGGTLYNGSYGAAVYAGMLSKQQLGVSLTHKTYPMQNYINYTTDKINYTKSQVENLIQGGFTVINKVGNYVGVERAVTKITDNTSPLFEQVVLFEIDYVKTNLYNILNPFIGQPNTVQKREEIKGIIKTFMNRTIIDKIINGYEVEVLLQSVDTVVINLQVEPTYPINTILVNLTI